MQREVTTVSQVLLLNPSAVWGCFTQSQWTTKVGARKVINMWFADNMAAAYLHFSKFSYSIVAWKIDLYLNFTREFKLFKKMHIKWAMCKMKAAEVGF